MKRKLRLVILIASLAGGGIISFQLFWMWNAYKINEDSFNKTASVALQRSIDQYQLASMNDNTCDCEQNPIIASNATIAPVSTRVPLKIKEKIDKIKQEMAKEKFSEKTKIVFKDTIQLSTSTNQKTSEINISGNDLILQNRNSDSEISQAMLRWIAKLKNQPIVLDSLSKIYKKELLNSNINLGFNLSFFKKLAKSDSPQIVGQRGFSTTNDIVKASFPNSFQWLLWRTLSPIVISFILIFLSIGSFWYLLHIIMHQRDLDNMKNEFINNMTHELQTPISILRSTHEALYDFGETANPERTNRYLKMNMTVIDKLTKDVERILDISEYEKHKIIPILAPTNLKHLIEEVILRFSLNRQGKINFSYNGHDENVITEAYAIDTILSNLIDNALKYAKEEGAQVWINVDFFTNYWQLQVIDNGIGMQTKHLPFIFDKFYRVPTGNLHNVKGYGLGLNYVKKLVELLNGEINVKSVPEQGTTFILKFERHEEN